MERVVIAVFMLVCAVSASDTKDPSHGWGDDINWLNSMDEAKTQAKSSNKPIMAIIHKSWCGACKALKPQVASSPDIASKSTSFVMANFEDDEEPAGDEFRLDGGYIPRIYFLSPEGTVYPEIYNKQNGNPQYKYYYSTPDAIVASMDLALQQAGSPKDKREL